MQGSVFKRIKSCDAKSCGCQIFCDKRIRENPGGFLEKVQVAEEAKAVLVVGRPFEVGKNTKKKRKKFLEAMGRAS